MIIAPYIAVLVIMMLVLAFQIIIIRLRAHISTGDGGDKVLRRRMRVFGNFTEYAPMIIGVLIACELSGVAPWKLHMLGFMGVLGRLSHAIAFQDFIRSVKLHLILRQPGMLLTILSLLLGAVFLIIG